MTAFKTYASIALLSLVTAVGLAACGGGSSSTGSSAAGDVSTKDVSGVGTVLVDAKGQALYSPEQEASGKILCTDSCTSIWVPLDLPSGQTAATAPDGIGSRLGVVTRPDGSKQVTFDGKPLYTFVEDGSPGTVTGNGAKDSFGGTSFTWHVVSPGSTTTGGTGTGYGY
jgi:predicted lipoprotein with Yx(FWY)xxD motif